METLTSLDYWIETQGNPGIILDNNNPIKLWMEAHVDFSEIKTAFEIGCYPGKFLTIPASKGVIVSGIDYIPQITGLEKIFHEHGYQVDEFINGDFLDFISEKKYDCVMSFGFLEHFKNWQEVLEKHLDLVSENGYLIMEVPNFRGIFQKLPRCFFDFKNFKRHNLKAMDPGLWQKILEKRGFRILHSGYLGGYSLWFEKQYRNKIINIFKYSLVSVLNIGRKILFPNKKEDKSFSSVIGIMAKRLVK